MYGAYDTAKNYAHTKAIEHKSIVGRPPTPRRLRIALDKERRIILAEHARYEEYSAAERSFGRLKNEFDGRNMRVRGHMKIICRLMFGDLY